jgi:hypothetical protein
VARVHQLVYYDGAFRRGHEREAREAASAAAKTRWARPSGGPRISTGTRAGASIANSSSSSPAAGWRGHGGGRLLPHRCDQVVVVVDGPVSEEAQPPAVQRVVVVGKAEPPGE